MTAAALGVAAGLALAMPVGPISLLILERSMAHGRGDGLAAAGGVATTGGGYAALAVSATALASAMVNPIRTPASLLAAAVIAVLGVRGLLSTQPELAPQAQLATTSRLRTYAAFVGLTAINPVTVLYFTALAVGFGNRLGDTSSRAMFVVGTGAGIFGWQSVVVGVGRLAARVWRPAMGRRMRQIGGVILLTFSVALAVDALRS